MSVNSIDTIHINFNEASLWVLNMALALVMFGIALEISLSDFKELFKNPKPILVGVLSQFLLLPAVTFLLVFSINPLPSVALGMFMVAACPGGNISNFITHMAKGNSALSVCLTAVATLLAIFMTPLNLEFWSSFYPPAAAILTTIAIAPLAMVKLVFLLLGIPLVAGMMVNYYLPALAKKVAKLLKVVSLIFFVVLIFIALYTNRIIFLEYVFYVFWIVVLHNLVAFTTGFSIAKVFGLSSENTRTITIETGIQNSGLGLLLIFTFFDGLGGMALLTAFWGIWHLVSGLILATFWSSKTIEDKKELA
ncbi:bile acid:sodium symporter family protein [Cellulophaga sp. Hel_I_12]|uniref:bile acid:sodium symporter family protein n=1 Tax=Cellulophaga sp. Hel_I_12 TaxID=1249972 RepID=UPI000648E3FB|nr:bile acid:sodium symporter family protein [Cellulophaga sp. Hel_I_12]